jgi:anti-anti-sigma factor
MSAEPEGLDLALDHQPGPSGEVAVLRAKGELDLAVAEDFGEAVGSAADDGASVVVDLRKLEFLDSSGLQVLLIAAGDLGRRLALLVEPESPVARLIEVTEVADRLPIYDTEAEAVTALGSERSEDGG